ncbi:RF-1 domain-containing protein [Aspergillus crustosus]
MKYYIHAICTCSLSKIRIPNAQPEPPPPYSTTSSSSSAYGRGAEYLHLRHISKDDPNNSLTATMLRHLQLSITRIAPISLRASPIPQRTLSASQFLSDKPLPPRLKLDDADITIAYLKGTGPGGQKINKTNSAVQLIHHPTGIVVKSQATRSRYQNEKYARQILADKVEQALKGDQSRTALKTERERKKKASKSKKSRRKYRELEDKKEGSEGEKAEEWVEVDEGVLDTTDEKKGRP